MQCTYARTSRKRRQFALPLHSPLLLLFSFVTVSSVGMSAPYPYLTQSPTASPHVLTPLTPHAEKAFDRLCLRIAKLESNLVLLSGAHARLALEVKAAGGSLKRGSSFVVVLIDGDGALCAWSLKCANSVGPVCLKFADVLVVDTSLINLGRNGGSQAASLLRQQTSDYLKLMGLGDAQIWARVCKLRNSLEISIRLRSYWKSVCLKVLHMHGLADAMFADGTIRSKQTFIDFCQGFSSATAMFDIVDVGPGKERSDSKLKEQLRQFNDIPQCQKLLVACTHDSGYYNELVQMRTDGCDEKIILLQSGCLSFPFDLYRELIQTVLCSQRSRMRRWLRKCYA